MSNNGIISDQNNSFHTNSHRQEVERDNYCLGFQKAEVFSAFDTTLVK